jgi:hypothetical protein
MPRNGSTSANIPFSSENYFPLPTEKEKKSSQLLRGRGQQQMQIMNNE